MSVSTADITRVIDGVPKGLLINGKQIQTGVGGEGRGSVDRRDVGRGC